MQQILTSNKQKCNENNVKCTYILKSTRQLGINYSLMIAQFYLKGIT